MSTTTGGLVMVRTFGVLAIAAGFVVGIYGLEHPESLWLPGALGLIVTGILAQGYALYGAVTRVRKGPSHQDQQSSGGPGA